jgi:hypothetical protein
MRTTLHSFFKKVLLGVLLITASNIILAQPTWTRVDYTSSTAFVGWVRINHYTPTFPVTVEVGDYIGAFVDGECRMIAEVFTYNGELYVSSVIHGGDVFDGFPSDDPNITSTAEEVEFKLWDISVNQEVSTQVKGTMFSDPGGEILDYEIGKPNTNSELENLEITGVTITPAFATSTTSYAVSLPAGSTLPNLADYVTSLVDSRATVNVDEATDFTTNNITTVTVTAEDGTTTDYTITFTEEECTVAAPTVVTPLEYCVEETAPQLTANGVDLLWYTTATSDDGVATAPIPSTDAADTFSYWVSQTDGCESERAEIEVVVNDTAAPVVTIDQTEFCEGDFAQLSVSGGTFSSYLWSGNGQAYLNQTDIANPTFSGDVAGEYSELSVSVVNEFGCVGSSYAPVITVNPTPTATLTPDASEVCEGEAIQITANTSETGTGTWSSTPAGAVTMIDNYTAEFIGLSPEQYEISYNFTSNNACVLEQAVTTTITVNPIPEAEITYNALEYCGGLSNVQLSLQAVSGVDLTGATFDLYQDGTLITENGTGSTLINFAPAGEYYVVVTLNGCEYTSAAVTVVQNPLPTVSITADNTNVCDDEDVVLTLDPATDGTLTGTGTSGLTFSPSLAGEGSHSLTYEFTDDNSCTNSAIETVTVTEKSVPTVAQTSYTLEIGASVPTLSASGSGVINWYDETQQVATDQNTYQPTISTDVDDTFTFYVTNTNGTCESDSIEITITVSGCSTAAPDVSTPVTYCQGDVASVLEAIATPTTATLNWYDASQVALTSAPTPSTDNDGTTRYYVSQTDGCEGTQAYIDVVVNPTPDVPLATDVEYCEGDAVADLTATPVTGATLNWYDDAMNPISDLTSPDAGTYNVSQTLVGCESETASLTVTINPLPTVSITADNTNVCDDEDVVLTLDPATDGTLTGTGTSGLTFSPSLAGEGSHSLTYEFTDDNSCTNSAIETVTVTEKSVPTVAQTSYTLEIGASVPTLSASGSGVINWYDETQQVATDQNTYQPTISTDVDDTFTFYVTNTNGTCESDSIEITITVSGCSTAAPDVSTPVTYCQGDVASVLEAIATPTTATLNWYDASQVALTSAPTPSTDNDGTTRYYVSQTDGCEGTQAYIDVVVNPTPDVPLATDVEYCEGDAVADLTATPVTGATLNWYDDAMNPISDLTSPDAGTYNVSQTLDACESETASLTVTINPLPTVTFSADAINNELCVGDELALSVAPAGGVLEVDGTEVAFEDLSAAIATVGEYTLTYTVTNSNTCVNSETIVLSVIDCECQVGAPEVADVDYCQGDDAVALTANTTTSNASLNWYDAQQNSLASAPIPSTDQAGTIQYFVSQTDECEGTKAAINVTVIAKPSTPVTEDVAYCDGDVIADLTATGDAGATLNWYDDAMNPIADITNPAEGTYNVSQIIDGCESETAQLSIHVFPIPDAPVVADVETCEGTTASLEASVVSQWYLTETDETPIATDASYTPTVTDPDSYTYYVAQTVNSCQSEKVLVTYTIVPNPTLIVNNEVAEFGTTIPDLSVTTDPVNTIYWYNTDEPPVFIQSGTSYATGETVIGTYYYQVEAVNGNCSSALQTISLEITDCMLAQPAVTASSNEVCFGDDNPIFNVTNASETVIWYADAQLSSYVHTGVEFQPTDSDVGTYTYYVVQEGECVSAKTTVSFEINALPVVAIYGPTSLYEDDAPATITVSPLGGSLLGSGLSGNMFDPASVIPGTYNLSYTYSDANDCENSTTHAIQVQERTYADRTQLGDTIARAQSVYNANESSNAFTQSAKTTLNNAIIAAQYYYDNYQNYTEAELFEQTNILSDAIQDFLDSRISTVDVSGLIAKINEAQGVYDDNLANQGTEPGDYPVAAFTDLDDAISDAEFYVTNPPATQTEVDNQIDILQDAIDAFYESEIPVSDVVSIEVAEATVNLVVGALFTPEVTFTPDGAIGDILWASSSSSVATVVAATGVVTAQSKGVTQMTGTLASDPSISVQYVVQVSGIPTVTNIEIANGIGDKLIITFSEQMQAPTNDIYTDLEVVGPNSNLVVTDVALDPNNNTKIIVDLGTVINNPDEIMVVYSGTSLQSIAGSQVAAFERRIDGTSIDAVAGVNVFVYPTIASSQVYVDGVGSAEQILIVTAEGKTIQTVPVTGNMIAIDIAKLAQGTYTVRIDFGTKTVQARFVKE